MKFNFFMSASEKEEIVHFKHGTSEDAIKGAFLDWIDSNITCGFSPVKEGSGEKVINFNERKKKILGSRLKT